MAIAQTIPLNQIKFVTIHHSAVKGVPANRAELLRRLTAHEAFHKTKNYPHTRGELGFTYLLYHFAVAGDGAVIPTQQPAYRLWHATDLYKGADSANAWGFGILLEGNFDVEKPTQKQLEAAAQIIRTWNTTHKTKLVIRSHQECARPLYDTSCCGKNCDVNTIRTLVEQNTPAPAPPAGNEQHARLDVLAEVERNATSWRNKVTNDFRKDEWQRVINYAKERAKSISK